MKKAVKKVLISFICLAVLLTAGFGTFKGAQYIKIKKLETAVIPLENKLQTLPQKTIYSDMLFPCDITVLRNHVSLVDYVFAAKVTEEIGTVYRNVKVINGKVTATPFVKYNIVISKNIKGNLATEKTLTLLKQGGEAPDGKSILIYGDGFLKVGHEYVFLAYKNSNGEIYIAESSTADEIIDLSKKEGIIAEYKKNMQLSPRRKRRKN